MKQIVTVFVGILKINERRQPISISERKDMDIVKDVKEILKLQNTHEKERGVEKLSDVFEYIHELSEGDVAEGVQLLLIAGLQENDQSLKESVFHAINNAVVYQHIGNQINWDVLAASLPSLGKWELEYALDILGISGQARYLHALEEYIHHPDPEIKEWAQEAINELKYRLAHATASQKGGRLTA
jgi:hypothetical protein